MLKNKLLAFARNLLGLAGQDSELSRRADPIIVKAMIPRSAFTKKGPGVRAQLREAVGKMTPDQRAVARRMGWIR